MLRLHVWVSGDVQGVGYRSFIKEKALELGITGWVKNLPDGRVEAAFQGENEQIQKMIVFCKSGPNEGTHSLAQQEEKPKNEKDFWIVG